MHRATQLIVIALTALMPLTAWPNGLITFKDPLIQGGLVRGKVQPGEKLWLNGDPVDVLDNGWFALGFGRDAESSQKLEIEHANGQRSSHFIEIEKREYRIQRIDGLPPEKVSPPESVLQRIRDDAARVRKARSIKSLHNGFLESFIWPADGVISGVYGSQRVLNGQPRRPHFGIDIAGPSGAPVVAPASGVVTMADPDLYYSGGTLIIEHGMGVFSTFLHMSTLDVKVGDPVEQGQKIGEIGSTGRSTGAHLDWRINWYLVRLDPATLVPAKDGLDYTSVSGLTPSQE